MKETALLQQTVDAVSGVEAAGSGARVEVVEELLRRKLRPDPRLVLLAMVVCNIAVMSQVDLRLVAICSVLTALALITARAWKTVITMLAIEGMWAFFLGLAPGLWPNVVTGFLAMVGLWLIRFTVSAALAGYFIIAVVPGELVASLRRLHVPIAITVPLTVLLRFLPMVASEYRAVREAMTLRGLSQGWRAWLHPLRYLEFVLVPMLFASTRIADEMTAAGMVRGLGSRRQPSMMTQFRFGLVDACWLLCNIGVAVLIPVWGNSLWQ